MDPIEIIVTQADATPTSSSTALNRIGNKSAVEVTTPRSNLELHFNALNKPSSNAKAVQSNRNIRRNPPNQAQNDAGTTSSSSNYNTPANSSDESRRPLLPVPSPSSSLQLTKKIKIIPSSTSNSPATASTTPSPTTTNSVSNRPNPPSNFPLFISLFVYCPYLLVLVSCVYCADRNVFVWCVRILIQHKFICMMLVYACAICKIFAPVYTCIRKEKRNDKKEIEEAKKRAIVFRENHIPTLTMDEIIHYLDSD